MQATYSPATVHIIHIFILKIHRMQAAYMFPRATVHLTCIFIMQIHSMQAAYSRATVYITCIFILQIHCMQAAHDSYLKTIMGASATDMLNVSWDQELHVVQERKSLAK